MRRLFRRIVGNGLQAEGEILGPETALAIFERSIAHASVVVATFQVVGYGLSLRRGQFGCCLELVGFIAPFAADKIPILSPHFTDRSVPKRVFFCVLLGARYKVTETVPTVVDHASNFIVHVLQVDLRQRF